METNNGWISVKDQMPDENVGVLVFIPDEDYHITAGMWDVSQKWVLLDEYRVSECEVTYWMPMPGVPEQYKKDIEEGHKLMSFLGDVLRKKHGIRLKNKDNG